MKSVGELIHESAHHLQGILKRVLPTFERSSGGKAYQSRVMTYFDHKIADHYSFFSGDILKHGTKTEEDGCKDHWTPFVPQILAPYGKYFKIITEQRSN